jgi:molecular chaperone DnaJ
VSSFFSNSKKIDYYRILGLEYNASNSEISKAFKQKVRIYHPDVNPDPKANQIFRMIREAYDVLSNEQKKSIYDSHGLSYEEQIQFKEGSFNQNSFSLFWAYKGGFYNIQTMIQDFKEFFEVNYRNQSFEEFKKQYKSLKQKGQDVLVEVPVSVEQLIHGHKTKVSYKCKLPCQTCSGKLYVPEVKKNKKKQKVDSKCQSCIDWTPASYLISGMKIDISCFDCKGTKYAHPVQCHSCKGEGLTLQTQSEEITILPDSYNGQVLSIEDKGGLNDPKGEHGNLLCKLLVDDSLSKNKFIRSKSDIISEKQVSVAEFVLQNKIEVPNLRYKNLLVSNPSKSKRIVSRGTGLVKEDERREKGDSITELKVQLNKKLSEKEKLLYLELACIEQGETDFNAFLEDFKKKNKWFITDTPSSSTNEPKNDLKVNLANLWGVN